MPLTEDEVYRGIMQLPGPCPRCGKEMWGFICEHCHWRVSDGPPQKKSDCEKCGRWIGGEAGAFYWCSRLGKVPESQRLTYCPFFYRAKRKEPFVFCPSFNRSEQKTGGEAR